MAKPTRPTGVSNGGRILCPGSTFLNPQCQVYVQRLSMRYIDSLALLQYRAILDFNVEQVNFLVILGNGALIINPDQGVLEPMLRSYLMYANIYMHTLPFCFSL